MPALAFVAIRFEGTHTAARVVDDFRVSKLEHVRIEEIGVVHSYWHVFRRPTDR